MSSFEEAKQALMKESASGGNVFDHLSGVILKILSENPEDAVAQFENLSLAVKKTTFSQANADGGSLSLSDDAKAAQIVAAESTLAKLKVGEDGATDAPQVQDLLGDSTLLEWAGISIGQASWFQLAAYMKNLVKEQAEAEEDALEIEKIRFWGKVLGCKGVDYYVYECQAPGRDIEIPEGVRMEGSDGPNRLTYFVVCSDDMGRARRLPDVTEAQIITARQIKKYMTGDLTAPVAAYPPFPGTEANFLRAQIAIISSDTFVAPTGFFALEESDEGLKTVKSKLGDDVEPEEKPECPGFDALASLETWSHYELPISKMGRMQAPPMGEDGETPDPYYGEPEELREPTQTLDADMDGESPNWKVQQCPSAGGPGSVSVVHSLKWPGAVAVYPCGMPRFVNCYVGYAVPNSTTTYTPPALPALQSEFASKFEEQPDVVDAPAPPVEEEDE